MKGRSEDGPPHLTLSQLFLKFFRFGWLAFGGPVAQIAMLRQALVEDERWISPARFNRLLAVMQALPGPEAHELSVHMGMIARGRWGGVLAGLGFLLPGLMLMLLCAWAYSAFVAGRPGLAAALLGVQIVVLAVIVRAVHRIGGHVLGDRSLLVLAAASALATLAGVPFWVPLAVAGLAYALDLRPLIVTTMAIVLLGLASAFVGDAGAFRNAGSIAREQASVAALFVAGLKGGLLTFGGAYTAIPYVRADTVGRGWLSDGEFLDGVALAGMLPAPLVIFGTFAGYVAGGWPGALALTAGMFLPAFAFSLIFFERLERIVENPSLHRLLDGIAAAVIGIIAATCAQLLAATFARVSPPWAAVPIFAAALLAAWSWKTAWTTPALILSGAVAGSLLFRR